MDQPIRILYILGAGRSGSTALATFLGASDDICFLGEMHQFHKYLAEEQNNKTSPFLAKNNFWMEVINQLPEQHKQKARQIDACNSSIEAHSKIPLSYFSLVNKRKEREYLHIQEELFSILQQQADGNYLLDSSKYIGRFLRLGRSPRLQVKGIYLVRDIRGVIWSFQKKVQTSTPPVRTILYYFLINLWGEIVYRTSPKGSMLKIRYEDFMENPTKILQQIGRFSETDMRPIIDKIKNHSAFSMPTIVGGNRIKAETNIYFRKDVEWVDKMPRWQKVAYHLIAWPLNRINGYTIQPRRS